MINTNGGGEGADPSTPAGLRAETLAIIANAAREEVTTRVLGGIAVALRCESARGEGPLSRGYSDIDLVVPRKDARRFAGVMTERGYPPNERFNAAHGSSRQIFYLGTGEDEHIDVFVDQFQLCHVLPLAKRLDLHPETISLEDLLLSKLQVAKLSQKDVMDTIALLLDHPLDGPTGEALDAEYVASFLSKDWGWWRTATETIVRTGDHVDGLGLTESGVHSAKKQLALLSEEIEAHPKSLGWRARAKIGDRRPWRIDPDDISV
jgi:hypothetical protein